MVLLSAYPESQSRLRRELRRARRGRGRPSDEWTYDALNELPYLDAVCRETLRLHAPTSWFWRT